MTNADDIEELASEYVLGTLDAAERATVAARRQREPALDIAIREWETRLAPLNELIAPVTPPPHLYRDIERRLAMQAAGTTAGPVELAELRSRLQRWRRLAIAASALAASLVLAIGVRETLWRAEPPTFVAVFAKDDILPSFYLTLDLEKRELTVRPIDAQRQPGKTYQLWIASDRLGPQPRSLGLVDEELAPTRKVLDFDRGLLREATFGVSLEPRGGSPTGKPTSPALHARLLPVSH